MYAERRSSELEELKSHMTFSFMRKNAQLFCRISTGDFSLSHPHRDDKDEIFHPPSL